MGSQSPMEDNAGASRRADLPTIELDWVSNLHEVFAHQFPFRAIRSDTGCRVGGWHSDTTSIKGVSLIRIACWWYMLLANQETVSHCAIVRYTSCNRHLSTTNFLLLGITYVPQNLPLLSQTTRSCSALRLAPPFGSITNSDSPPALHEFGNVKPFVANFQHRACGTRDEHLLRRFRRGEEICPPYISAIFITYRVSPRK